MTSDNNFRKMADTAADVLAGWHDEKTGTWPECWWQSANALEALIDFTALTGDDRHRSLIGVTFEQAQRQAESFLNKYYDDEGWWALTWIKAFDLTAEARYLDMARLLFDDMALGWDETFGGGVWWTKERGYKNAIPNELFLVLATRLHQRTGEGTYLDWAHREWDWFLASGMLNAQSLINDGLTAQGQNNGGVTWTYNQGVVLGGLTELYRTKQDDELMQRAQRIADAAMSQLSYRDGILREPCEDPAFGRACDGDQELFKGIFMRYLACLHEQVRRPVYADVIRRNAASLWEHGQDEDGRFGLCWKGPFDGASVQRQTAALDLFNAALRVSK